MKQIKVGLSDNAREYFEECAQKNGRSLSEEVRIRLDQTRLDDRFDLPTKELGQDIMQLARMISMSTKWTGSEGWWSNDIRQFEALKVAVETWLNETGNSVQLAATGNNSTADPVTLGKSTAAGYAQLKPLLIRAENIREGDHE